MRHLKSGRKLKRTASHRKALLSNMAMSLFENKRIKTTEAKAKELRPFAESLITRAKHALQNEQNGTLPSGQSIDIHNRRQVARYIKQKKILEHLFVEIAPVIANRNGGYLRITKLGQRRGDGGKVAIIEFVDYSNAQDGISSRTRRKKGVKAPVATVTATPTPVVSPPMDETIADDISVETPEVATEADETPVAQEEAIESTTEPASSEPSAEQADSTTDSGSDASAADGGE